jgi:hypothetical protein
MKGGSSAASPAVRTTPDNNNNNNSRRPSSSSWTRRLARTTLSSAGVVFRTTTGLGALLFVLEYARLIKVSVHSSTSVPRMDWNVFETPLTVDLSSTTTNESPISVARDTANKPAPIVLPAWVTCADGRNVSSCHECSATNEILSCDGPSPDCQWCPYGAAFVGLSTQSTTAGIRRHADGIVVHNAHVPIGQQCVSRLQSCRPPATALYEQDVLLRETRPFVAKLVRKAALHTMQQRCKGHGFQPCPYGLLTSYHDGLNGTAMTTANLTRDDDDASPQPHRPAQCVPKAFHCQPKDDLLVQPWDALYRKRYGSAVVLPAPYRLIFVPMPKGTYRMDGT